MTEEDLKLQISVELEQLVVKIKNNKDSEGQYTNTLSSIGILESLKQEIDRLLNLPRISI